MIRHDYSRVDPKRRADINYKKRQFAKAEYQQQNYEHRLNYYILPPTAEITLEEFETWAIDRLKGTMRHMDDAVYDANINLQFSPNWNHAASATEVPKKLQSTWPAS